MSRILVLFFQGEYDEVYNHNVCGQDKNEEIVKQKETNEQTKKG